MRVFCLHITVFFLSTGMILLLSCVWRISRRLAETTQRLFMDPRIQRRKADAQDDSPEAYRRLRAATRCSETALVAEKRGRLKAIF